MKMIWQLYRSLGAYERCEQCLTVDQSGADWSVGVVGMLTEAKHSGRINAIKPYLDTLRDAAGFRVRQALYVRVLEDAGEL